MTAARLPKSGPAPVRVVFDAARAPVVVLDLRVLTAGPSPRTSPADAAHVAVLAGLGGSLPPIVVQRHGLRVIDGVHRVRAAVLRGDDTIEAQLFDGSDDEAFLLALRCNIGHGLPLTLAERKAAATRVLATHPDWSDRAVAVTVGLSDKTVGALRRGSDAEFPQSIARLGADGRVRPVDCDRRRRLAAELIAAHPDSPLRHVAASAGISVGTARDVRARLRRGEDPVPPRRRAGTRVDPDAAVRAARPALDIRQRLVVLERLRSDPSVRFSVTGRAAVRWLAAGISGPERWADLVDTIPLHWAERVADLAHSCAQVWTEFAVACEQRAHRAEDQPEYRASSRL